MPSSEHPEKFHRPVRSFVLRKGRLTIAQARALEPQFEEMLHSFDDHPLVIDVRNFGLMGAIEMAPRDGAPGARGAEVHKRCFWDENIVVRAGMDTLQFAPFLNADADELAQAFEGVRRVLDTLA